MRAVNNIYYTQEHVCKRFAKACKFTISGSRLNPDDHDRVTEFILCNPTNEFNYENDVVELYSEKELRFFLQRNKYLIEKGFIKEYNSGPKAPVFTSMMTDEEVEEIAGIRTIPKLEERLRGVTSVVTLKRIYDAAEEIGKSKRILETIQSFIDKAA